MSARQSTGGHSAGGEYSALDDDPEEPLKLPKSSSKYKHRRTPSSFLAQTWARATSAISSPSMGGSSLFASGKDKEDDFPAAHRRPARYQVPRTTSDLAFFLRFCIRKIVQAFINRPLQALLKTLFGSVLLYLLIKGLVCEPCRQEALLSETEEPKPTPDPDWPFTTNEEYKPLPAYLSPPQPTDNGLAAGFTSRNVHPVRLLADRAEKEYADLLQKQSKTLEQAVAEYWRRYKMPPPPYFDKWFEFVQKNDVLLPDEFDAVYETLLPFWALKPHTLRYRVQELLGFTGDNGVVGVIIRKGKVKSTHGGPQWQRDMIEEMLSPFVKYLPNMDLAFNGHDEPRVIVPFDSLELLRDSARESIAANYLRQSDERSVKFNAKFSPPPSDVDPKGRLRTFKTTRYNEIAHQQIWSLVRLSCPPTSPAREPEEDMAVDDTKSFAQEPFGYIMNQTASHNICTQPSLRLKYGMFQRPNAFKLTVELMPVFSQSKASTFNDILFPSPWYFYGKVATAALMEDHPTQYDPERDVDWEEKKANMWWRGSTTGGYSRRGDWRNSHRQRFIDAINADDTADVLKYSPEKQEWTVSSDSRRVYQTLFNLTFSHVGQCESWDCSSQVNRYNVTEKVDGQSAWEHRFLLDIDGNAFSGRFYAMLRSKSLPIKASIMDEWHFDNSRVRPWVHYVPANLHPSLTGHEIIDILQYFTSTQEGEALARKMAMAGRQQVQRALRRVDMQAYFFRLMLEYARLIDEGRDEGLGFNL